jgi:hypothetical protein
MNPRPPTLLARLRLRHARLRSDDSGQALLAVGILSLALVMFATSVMPVGAAVQRRIQTQNAADFAALSAGTWFARGANMIQAGNGFEYDVHTAAVLAVEITTYVYMAKIIKDVAEVFEGNIFAAVEIILDWFEGIDKIAKVNRYAGYCRMISEFPRKTMHPGYAQLALAEANSTARLNGASPIDSQEHLDHLFAAFDLHPPDYEDAEKEVRKWLAEGESGTRWWDTLVGVVEAIPVIGSFIAEAIEELVETESEEFDFYAWPLSPSFEPETAFKYTQTTKFKEWGAQPEGLFSPLRSHFYWPFVCSVFFLQFIDWDAEFVRLASEMNGGPRKHVSTTYTLAVREHSEDTYAKLPLVSTWFKTASTNVAVASVSFSGGRLTDAGTTDAARWYFSTPVFAFSFWPLPFVRLFYNYGSDFEVAQVPVVFQDGYGKPSTKGTDKLIFH